MAAMLDWLGQASLFEVSWFFLVTNILVFVGSISLCWVLGRCFGSRRIFDRWEPLRPIEIAASIACLLLNTVVSVVGWAIWQAGWITVESSSLGHDVFDCLAMIMGMDFGMYVFHRVAHYPPIYRLLHSFHHRHEATNPLSLFVLHPLEVIGFGGLMITFLVLYPMTLNGLMAYLGLNVLFGTLGHSGVEPFPASWNTIPGLRLVGSSTFHAGHHSDPKYNFGFYTLIWDKLFGTLDPQYDARFKRL